MAVFPLRFCCQNDAERNLSHSERIHYTVVFSIEKLHTLFSHHARHFRDPFYSELPLMRCTLMVFMLLCQLDSFPDANGIKAMATSLACH